MKNLLFGFLIIGVTGLGYSQVTQEVQLEDVVLTNINRDYLDKVQNKDVAESVKNLEHIASKHDISASSLYDGRDETFRSRFIGSKGFIDAYYNKDGVILSTLEKYKNIKLPEHIRNSVFIEFPEWLVDRSFYVVFYDKDKYTEKTYKLLLKKGGKKKKLKVDSNGMIN